MRLKNKAAGIKYWWIVGGGIVLIAFCALVIFASELFSENLTVEEQETTVEVGIAEESTTQRDASTEDATTQRDASAEDAMTQRDASTEAAMTMVDDKYQGEWSVPLYNGQASVDIKNNRPDFDEQDKQAIAFEQYSSLDALGRCGVAYACIGTEIMPTEPRGEIGLIKPSGWHTIKYNDLIDGNYLYNRCHLIGYQLAGENANEKNLITGTRYLNMQGMLVYENEVANYVQSTGNHVLYRVTPHYEGDNLLASGVEMEAYSVEDNGEGVSFHVYCFNVQPGISIDYRNGDSWALEQSSTEADSMSEYDYVLNTNTKKIHHVWCDSVNEMKAKNRKGYNGTLDELIEKGYSPCQRCNP